MFQIRGWEKRKLNAQKKLERVYIHYSNKGATFKFWIKFSWGHLGNCMIEFRDLLKQLPVILFLGEYEFTLVLSPIDTI